VSNGRPHRRRLSETQTHLADVFGPLDDARVPGGCAACDAYQTAEPGALGVWTVTVHHDDWCPILEAMAT
jgi:hypothetical protein